MVFCKGPHRSESNDSPSTTTAPDGSFELTVAPGRNVVSFPGPAGGTFNRSFRFVDTGEAADTYVLTPPGGGFYAGSSYQYQVDGGSPKTTDRIWSRIALAPRSGETHTLSIRLRRLRPATFSD